jgi:hypothetical protein
MSGGWFERVRSLLEAPSPAVLATYREDGTTLVSPVWFRWYAEAFEVVIAEGDVKLRHLAANPECELGGTELALAGAPDLRRDDEIDLLEDPDVLPDAVEGETERLCQLADRRRSIR